MKGGRHKGRINRREQRLKAEREKREAERKALLERLKIEIMRSQKALAQVEIMQAYIKGLDPLSRAERICLEHDGYSQRLLRESREIDKFILATVVIVFSLLAVFAIYKNLCN